MTLLEKKTICRLAKLLFVFTVYFSLLKYMYHLSTDTKIVTNILYCNVSFQGFKCSSRKIKMGVFNHLLSHGPLKCVIL